MTRRPGHIRKRSPSSFEVRYTLGTDPATGRRRTITATIKGSRKDAEKELRRLLRTVDVGDHVAPDKVTLTAWAEHWIAIGCPGQRRRKVGQLCVRSAGTWRPQAAKTYLDRY